MLITLTVQKIIGDKLVTDRQTTDNRQTDIFELTPIHKGNFKFFITFFCIWEGEYEWGENYTSLLATQVCFAHLLCSQGDNRLIKLRFPFSN